MVQYTALCAQDLAPQPPDGYSKEPNSWKLRSPETNHKEFTQKHKHGLDDDAIK